MANAFSPVTPFIWEERERTLFTVNLILAYEKKIFWNKNLFMLPTGSTKKKYFKKVTTPLKAWTQDTLRSINLKAIQNMLVSFMQKPSKTSKSRDHLDALERRLQL